LFSGIIQEIGKLEVKKGGNASFRFIIGVKTISPNLLPGDSISVDGVCLTVEDTGRNQFTVYSSPETINRTTLSKKEPGSLVNLELALSPTGRVNGHFVLGHVDGVGKIIHIKKEADSWRFAFQIPSALFPFCVEKGSIAIDGISLTIAAIREKDHSIEIAVIPYTFENTTLKHKKQGDMVNVETDIFAKYTQKFLSPYLQKNSIADLLQKAGFIEE